MGELAAILSASGATDTRSAVLSMRFSPVGLMQGYAQSGVVGLRRRIAFASARDVKDNNATRRQEWATKPLSVRCGLQ